MNYPISYFNQMLAENESETFIMNGESFKCSVVSNKFFDKLFECPLLKIDFIGPDSQNKANIYYVTNKTDPIDWKDVINYFVSIKFPDKNKSVPITAENIVTYLSNKKRIDLLNDKLSQIIEVDYRDLFILQQNANTEYKILTQDRKYAIYRVVVSEVDFSCFVAVENVKELKL